MIIMTETAGPSISIQVHTGNHLATVHTVGLWVGITTNPSGQKPCSTCDLQ